MTRDGIVDRGVGAIIPSPGLTANGRPQSSSVRPEYLILSPGGRVVFSETCYE